MQMEMKKIQQINETKNWFFEKLKAQDNDEDLEDKIVITLESPIEINSLLCLIACYYSFFTQISWNII